jgi:hypothetical protein
VVFDLPFANTPLVHLGIVGLDISNEDYARLTVRTGKLGPVEFEIVAETRFNTQAFQDQVSWLALGH